MKSIDEIVKFLDRRFNDVKVVKRQDNNVGFYFGETVQSRLIFYKDYHVYYIHSWLFKEVFGDIKSYSY